VVAGVLAALQVSTAGTAGDDLSTAWSFARGTSGEGLVAVATSMPRVTGRVDLPHRVLAPNTPLWYRRGLAIPAGRALLVHADDGAQVFVDGQRLANHARWFPVPDGSGGNTLRFREVTVRVLNNALRGGLTSVRIVPTSTIDRSLVDREPLPAGLVPVETARFREQMPGPGQSCDFTAWADSQGGWDTFARLASMMAEVPHDFSVGVGDLVDDGSNPAAWRAFIRTVTPLARRVPVVAIAGNHDYDGFYNDLRARLYLDLLRPGGRAPWFAWSCGVVRLVAIDLNTEFPLGVSEASPQGQWLKREMESDAWRRASWRILLVHQPPYSRSWAGYDGDEATRRVVERLVAQGELDLVIAGHSHAYEHLAVPVGRRRLHVLITGGAGGALEAPRASGPEPGRVVLAHHFVRARATRGVFAVEAIDIDGRHIDRWQVARERRQPLVLRDSLRAHPMRAATPAP